MATTFDFSPVVTPDGHFYGYGAVFDNIDSHRDVISRGAFSSSLTTWRSKGRWPAMKLQHGSNGNVFTGDDLPIGRWLSMNEDSHGLYVEGQLLALETDQGRRLLSLMRGGVLDAMSIGYVVKRSNPGVGRIGRYLVEVDLREVSIVDTPSNELARISPITATDAAFDKLRAAVTGLTGNKTAKPSHNADPAFARLMVALRNAAT
jgi:HK97 family phage prohead protease